MKVTIYGLCCYILGMLVSNIETSPHIIFYVLIGVIIGLGAIIISRD